VSFDYLDVYALFGITDELIFDFTPTGEFDDTFSELGYDNRNTVQLCGFANIIILLMVVDTILVCFFKLPCWNSFI
jgi:hypothetical protein